MKVIKDKSIQESEMHSERKENLIYAAQLLCEAFYGAAQNGETIYAGRDIDQVVKVFSDEVIKFIQREPMWISGKFKMDQKDKNIRVKHFIDGLIKALK